MWQEGTVLGPRTQQGTKTEPAPVFRALPSPRGTDAVDNTCTNGVSDSGTKHSRAGRGDCVTEGVLITRLVGEDIQVRGRLSRGQTDVGTPGEPAFQAGKASRWESVWRVQGEGGGPAWLE